MESKFKQYMQEKKNFDIKLYQDYIKDLYIDINSKRNFEDFYGYLDRTSGYLCKGLLKATQDDKMFILPISWLFSLSTHLNIDVQKAFIKKYPSVCPYCLEPQCVCIRTGKLPLHHTPIHKRVEKMEEQYDTLMNTIKVYSFDIAAKNVMDIYAVNETIWRFAGAWHHIAKIHEEIAEIHEAHGSYKNDEKSIDNIAEEIADVLAWILGAWGILNPGKSIDETFIGYYYKDCPLCHSFPCKCKPYDSRLDSIIDIKQLYPIKEKLEEVNLSLSNSKELSELISSYGLVLKTQDGPSVRYILAETNKVLKDVSAKVSSSKNEDLVINSTIENIIRNINLLLKLEGGMQINPANVSQPIKNKFDVFLSYSTADKDEARKIETFLKKKKINVFLSEKTIKPGDEWKNEIREALENSRLLCILATPNSLKSDWVTREQGAAWGLRIRILPILFQCAAKDLPDILQDYQSINFHETNKIIDVLKGMP